MPMRIAARFAVIDDGPERAKTLDLLREAGVSVKAVDGDGFTPGQVARRNELTSKEELVGVSPARQ
jgi:hypothetical protein